MSEETRAALLGAVTDHRDARNGAALSGQDPDTVDRADAEAAARAHLDDADPGYLGRETGDLHSRRVAPDLQDAYQAARDAADAAPGDPGLALAAADLAHELAAASIARRLLEGRKFASSTGG
jgi:hypothetical protein